MKKIMFVFLFLPALVFGQKLAEVGPKHSSLPSDALYILDDKVISYNDIVMDSKNNVVSVKSIAPEKINTIQILKDGAAIEKYGDAGKNGVIIMTSKKYAKKLKRHQSSPH